MPKRTVLTLDELRTLCMALPGTTEDIKWGDHVVFSVGTKMYAVWGGRYLSFKVPEPLMHAIVETDNVIPAPYMARHHWVAFNRREGCGFYKKELKQLIEGSYKLVFAKLPKKTQRDLGQ